jgi:hypothetical protein
MTVRSYCLSWTDLADTVAYSLPLLQNTNRSRNALSKSRLDHLDVCCYSRFLCTAIVAVMSVTRRATRVGSALCRPFCVMHPPPLPPRHFRRSPAIEFRRLGALAPTKGWDCAKCRPLTGRTDMDVDMSMYLPVQRDGTSRILLPHFGNTKGFVMVGSIDSLSRLPAVGVVGGDGNGRVGLAWPVTE